MTRALLAAAAVSALAFAAACSEPAPPASGHEAAAPAEPASAAASPTAASIRGEDIAWRVNILADDVYEGRDPATEAGLAASQWIADDMARVGIEPAGEDGTYFQAVPLVESTLDEAASSFSITGSGGDVALSFGSDVVYWTKTPREETSFDAADVVFVGYGVVAPEYGWNDYEGLDVAGKTVVMLVNDPGFATEDPELFNGRAMTYYGRWTYKYEEAGRQGAAAAIIVHETEPASYGWNVVESSWTGAQYDLERPDGGAGRTALEGWVTREAAERVFASASLDFAALKEDAAKPGFRAVALDGVQASGRVVSAIRRMASRNVAGVVRGGEHPDEYVLYTAHWDHLGKKADAAPGEDAIYNGAVDNATGVAAILEIGEAFAKAPEPPRRSVLLLAVTAEESGLLGSAYYAEDPLVPLAKTVGGMNIDAMLPSGEARDVVVIGRGASQLEDILAEEAAAQDRVLAPDPNPEAGHFYRSDHVSFAKKGVPMLYAESGEDLVEGGAAAGKALSDAYRETAYHQPSDEYDPTWDMTGIVEDAQMLYGVGERLANSNIWPEWREGNEFRAIREASLAGDG